MAVYAGLETAFFSFYSIPRMRRKILEFFHHTMKTKAYFSFYFKIYFDSSKIFSNISFSVSFLYPPKKNDNFLIKNIFSQNQLIH